MHLSMIPTQPSAGVARKCYYLNFIAGEQWYRRLNRLAQISQEYDSPAWSQALVSYIPECLTLGKDSSHPEQYS